MKSPAILTLQETKFKMAGNHKLDGYIIYEHLRTEKTSGGGVFMAVVQELNPALVRDGGTNIEALTVDINVKKMQIPCTTAYGPQENDPKPKKELFWKFLDEEAKRADEENKGFILQGDLNSWVGKTIIPNDPRLQNQNGKLMADFLKRNNLTVVNGLDLCKGLFTRVRKSKNTCEKSILDYFVVCSKILPLIQSMTIDQLNVPTNYTQVRKGGKSVDSDHVPLEMVIDLKIVPTRPTREIIYNFKSEQGIQLFKDITSSTKDFTNCFENMQPLQVQCEQWQTLLKSYCEQAFPKIRVRTKRLRQSQADYLIKERNIIKKKQDNNSSNNEEDTKVKKLEKEIANIIAEEERNKAYNIVHNMVQ